MFSLHTASTNSHGKFGARIANGATLILLSSMLAGAAMAESSATAEPAAYSPRTVTLSTDNDLFSPIQNDRDYTAGVALAYSGEELAGGWNVVGRSLDTLNQSIFGADATAQGPGALEFGVYGFTPENIGAQNVMTDDRPYSSLVYLSASQQYAIANSRSTLTSSLTVGALGLDVFETGQNAIHKVIDSPRAEGWEHQVSDGGELTARYALAYHTPLGDEISDQQFKTSVFGSVGYVTEVGAALMFREGLISSPADRFHPEFSTYGEGASAAAAGKADESYFWGGVAVKARVYNAFLEGQFRDSEHTVARSKLNVGLVEGWAGYTQSFMGAYKFSYVVRVQSSEIKEGAGDRTLAWGGLMLSKTF